MDEKILVLDFGGQYNLLIARRVRELHVYAEIRPYNKIAPEEIRQAGYKGIILTGGPNSVYADGAPLCDPALLGLGIPVLGICYGAQLMAFLAGGEIREAENGGEYGKTALHIRDDVLFGGVPAESVCWMSHRDFVQTPPSGFAVTAQTDGCPCAAFADAKRRLYGVQFHPEVTHTAFGRQMLHNFLYAVCGCQGLWSAEDFAAAAIERCRSLLAGKKVLLALSGGVDSSVAALLLHRAVGDRLTCVFVDHGLLRKGEGDFVEQTFRGRFGLHLIRVNAEERFLHRLKGITEPEEKRRVIGEEFIRVFEAEAKKLGKIDVLAQGTIYPDVVESGRGDAAVIKSHHNVGGLPKDMKFKLVEPVERLFKDEVRVVGRLLGLPSELIDRHPFPGPSLGVRHLGAIDRSTLKILREADAIVTEELMKSGWYHKTWQTFAIFVPVKTVGMKNHKRTYDYVIAIRSINSVDAVTAQVVRLPWELLDTMTERIIREVEGVNRVVYDITSKPPGTIEWE